MSEMKTANPRIPSPLTAGIFAVLWIDGIYKTWYDKTKTCFILDIEEIKTMNDDDCI